MRVNQFERSSYITADYSLLGRLSAFARSDADVLHQVAGHAPPRSCYGSDLGNDVAQ